MKTSLFCSMFSCYFQNNFHENKESANYANEECAIALKHVELM